MSTNKHFLGVKEIISSLGGRKFVSKSMKKEEEGQKKMSTPPSSLEAKSRVSESESWANVWLKLKKLKRKFRMQNWQRDGAKDIGGVTEADN